MSDEMLMPALEGERDEMLMPTLEGVWERALA